MQSQSAYIKPLMPVMPSMQKREHCPSCNSPSFTSLYHEPYSGAGIKKYLAAHYEGRASNDADEYVYELVQCTDCNLAYQPHVPTGQLLSEIYDEWIPRTELNRIRHGMDLDNYRYFAEQIQFIIQHLQMPPHLINVLDFGFGWAEWAKMAIAFGCNVTGSELSRERLDYAQSIGLKTIDFSKLPDNTFHFINTEQVFEHLVEPRTILEGLVKALAPNGIIKISVPNAKASIRKITQTKDISLMSRQEIMPIAPLEHINAFDADSLVALGKAAGLQVLRPSLYTLYNSCSGLMNVKNAGRLLARQIYRHIYPKSTFIYFVRA